MAYRDGLSFFSLQLQADDAGKILPEIIDQLFPHVRAGNGFQLLVGSYGRAVCRQYCRMYPQIFPFRTSPCDPFQIHAGVIGLAVINVGHPVIAVLGHIPVKICSDHLGCAVGILKTDFHKKCLTVCRYAVLPGKDIGSGGPSSGHVGVKNILFLKQAGYIVGLILQAGLVGGKSRCKVLVSHLAAVKGQLIDSHGSGIDFCRPHLFFQ